MSFVQPSEPKIEACFTPMFVNKVNVNKHCTASKHDLYYPFDIMDGPSLHPLLCLSMNLTVVTFLQPHRPSFYRNSGGEDALLLFHLLIATLKTYSDDFAMEHPKNRI